MQSGVSLVKQFFSQGASREVHGSEMILFWKACTPEEKKYFAEAAAKELGVELEYEPGVAAA